MVVAMPSPFPEVFGGQTGAEMREERTEERSEKRDQGSGIRREDARGAEKNRVGPPPHTAPPTTDRPHKTSVLTNHS